MKLGKIKDIVTEILAENEYARDSDDRLYYEVINKVNPKALNCPLSIFLLNRNEMKIPSRASVERARRKAVELNPSLAGNSQVESFRTANEQDFKEFAHCYH